MKNSANIVKAVYVLRLRGRFSAVRVGGELSLELAVGLVVSLNPPP